MPIGQGAGPGGITFAQEYFNVRAPFRSSVSGFLFPQRIRFVGIPIHGHAKRFAVNLRSNDDIVFHFNPRFDEHCVVRNSTKNGTWQREERFETEFPFHHDKVFTLEFVAEDTSVSVYHNGIFFVSFELRDSCFDIREVEIEGDIDIHSVHVTQI
ncbi:hypothetical protein QR680_013695 [Steinernema hermaphroditum]|uniref:Galectin n=1 Tax=Steinernema hermaphroditum TaxID=289476 RepID=A0AA39I7Z6_9BILA|nr:hypothetical protein QR680_013695 [Steinernema hermaphroditum]